MTELLASFTQQLSSQGQVELSRNVAQVARGYRSGVINYQQAMEKLTEVVGRPALVAEVCRLSKLAGAEHGICACAAVDQTAAAAVAMDV